MKKFFLRIRLELYLQFRLPCLQKYEYDPSQVGSSLRQPKLEHIIR